MATFKAVILTGKEQVRSDGFVQIKIRVTQNRDSAYIPTDLYLFPKDFNGGFATGKDSDWINSRIIDYLRTYTDRYLRIGDKAHEMTADEIRRAVMAKDEKQHVDFIAYAEKYLKTLLDANKTGTWRSARWLVKHLKDFSGKINFDEIDSDFLFSFERYLKKQGAGNVIPTYMARMRSIFNKGRAEYNDEDRGLILIPNYPFKRYKIRTPETDANQHALTADQVRDLISYKPLTARETLGRDVFLIMLCLAGPNTKDLYLMSGISKGRISYSRSKTGHKFSVKIEPELMDLINRYQGAGKMIFNFSESYCDYLNFQAAVNKGLKSISENLGWPRVSSNWARHTWATICRNDLGVNKDDVALCLGHEDRDNRVTDMYVRYDNSIQDTVNRKLIDFIFKTSPVKKIARAEVYLN